MHSFEPDKITPDDPRLTAYALGELEGEERARFEAAVAADPALQTAVEEIANTAAQLGAALATEPEPVIAAHHDLLVSLPPLTVETPLAESGARRRVPRKLVRFPYILVASAAAACFAVFFVQWNESYQVRKAQLEKEHAAAYEAELARLHAARAEAAAALAREEAALAFLTNAEAPVEVAETPPPAEPAHVAVLAPDQPARVESAPPADADTAAPTEALLVADASAATAETTAPVEVAAAPVTEIPAEIASEPDAAPAATPEANTETAPQVAQTAPAAVPAPEPVAHEVPAESSPILVAGLDGPARETEAVSLDAFTVAPSRESPVRTRNSRPGSPRVASSTVRVPASVPNEITSGAERTEPTLAPTAAPSRSVVLTPTTLPPPGNYYSDNLGGTNQPAVAFNPTEVQRLEGGTLAPTGRAAATEVSQALAGESLASVTSGAASATQPMLTMNTPARTGLRPTGGIETGDALGPRDDTAVAANPAATTVEILTPAAVEFAPAAGRETNPGIALEGQLKNLQDERKADLARDTSEQRASGRIAAAQMEIAHIQQELARLRAQQLQPNTESYDVIRESGFLAAGANPLSTFAIDVDTASYANVRRFLQADQAPPRDAVRIEELVNYFSYDYAPPPATDVKPFAAHLEVAAAPWAPEHRLVRVGLKGRELADENRPPANLVFLVDVSGSMQPANKLPLVKESLRLFVDRLQPQDRVAIAVYAGSSGLALPSTPVERKREIVTAIEALQASGSTNGAIGLQLAYDIAKANFVEGGVNRVILATDGDFNVGLTTRGELERLITEKARSGVFLTTLGFGYGNLKDSTLEQLADRGNGHYAYIDTLREAGRVLVQQATSTLVTIAQDVKVQVEFNPAHVQAWRLIGYENRALAAADFNNDNVDAGEIGAGHTVTALYEIVPAGVPWQPESSVDALRYQVPAPSTTAVPAGVASDELLTVKVRYKAPGAGASELSEFSLTDHGAAFAAASSDFKFAAAVAGFGLVLRDSPYKGTATFDLVEGWARDGRGRDVGDHRTEFIDLVQRAKQLVQL